MDKTNYNPIEDLHNRLEEAGIPHVWRQELNDGYEPDSICSHDKDRYLTNQILYPNGYDCLFDVVWQLGSWFFDPSCDIESYHELGCDKDGMPRIISVDHAFQIIDKDWQHRKGEVNIDA